MFCSICGALLKFSRSLIYYFCQDCDGTVDSPTHPAIYQVGYDSRYIRNPDSR